MTRAPTFENLDDRIRRIAREELRQTLPDVAKVLEQRQTALSRRVPR